MYHSTLAEGPAATFWGGWQAKLGAWPWAGQFRLFGTSGGSAKGLLVQAGVDDGSG